MYVAGFLRTMVMDLHFGLKTYSVREKMADNFVSMTKQFRLALKSMTKPQLKFSEKSFQIAIRFHLRWNCKLYSSAPNLNVSLCIFQTGVQGYKKIHLDTWYLNVSFRPGGEDRKNTFRDVVSKCIFLYLSTPFGKIQKRYIQIHVDTLWYIQMHRPQKIVRTETNIGQTFLRSFNFQIPGVQVTQTHCMWTSSRTSGPQKKKHAGEGCFYKTMSKLDHVYP